MMLYPAMSKLNSYIPNRYMLVNVVARRARQIAEEAEASGAHLDEKPVTLAINELATAYAPAPTTSINPMTIWSPGRWRGWRSPASG